MHLYDVYIILYFANQGSREIQKQELTTYPSSHSSFKMADPRRSAPDTFFIKNHDAFIQKFHDVDDAIQHEQLGKLLPLLRPSWEWELEEAEHDTEPLNLSNDPLLSVVIAYGKTKLAIELIENMLPVNLLDGNVNGDTALHVAVEKGHECVVKKLAETNGDLLRARNQQMEIPLHKAALFGRSQIFWNLVEHGSDVFARRKDGATMLHCAVMGNAPGTSFIYL